jgi:RHS repeat-associated protein
MVMPKRTYSAGRAYKYGFNGKEGDFETATQDYGMRIYEPKLGRFLSVDPLAKKYPWYTPYQFAGNKPIQFIDLDGLEEAKPENDGQPKGSWYRRQSGQNVTYSYTLDKEVESGSISMKGAWKIPDANRSRIITGEHGVANIDLNVNGTFTVVKTNLEEDAVNGHVKWHMPLANGGNLYVEARDFMQSKAVGNGSFTGAVEALAGEKIASIGLKGLGKLFGGKVASSSNRLVGFGSDEAVTQGVRDLLPKKGWYDVVVHGSEDGLGFTVNGSYLTPNQLYSNMLANGYQQGTRIRLMACYAGSVSDGAAFQLSKLTGAPVVAPTSTMWISTGQGFLKTGKLIVDNGGRFKLFK